MISVKLKSYVEGVGKIGKMLLGHAGAEKSKGLSVFKVELRSFHIVEI